MFRRLPKAVLIAVAVSTSGCGGSEGTAPAGVAAPVNEPPKAMLEELGAILKYAADLKKKPPARMEEIYQYEPVGPAALGGLADQKIVYLWGAPYKPNGNAIVAYQAGIETTGGWVLLENATVKQMSAEEFKSGAKAK